MSSNALHRRRTSTLPAELTSFVGRRQEVAEVKRLLSVSRMVTLTGPGGVGKTRLALQVADRLRRAFPTGCGWSSWRLWTDPSCSCVPIVAALEVRDHRPGGRSRSSPNTSTAPGR